MEVEIHLFRDYRPGLKPERKRKRIFEKGFYQVGNLNQKLIMEATGMA